MATKTATRRPRVKVDPNATPEEKFIRLANKRGKKLCDLMHLVENLSTSYAYKVDHELAKKWLNDFQTSFDGLKRAWEAVINNREVPLS